ncbi:MAG: DUF5615 family PIN-like protein [Planctomycetota bacterium]|nr:DUF5615 family PIN-like protein [Planctomycetota bacterium]
MRSDDEVVWDHARLHGFVLLTKDKDFQQLSAVRGALPKVVWLRVGNRSTVEMVELLRRRHSNIESFERDPKKALLILIE